MLQRNQPFKILFLALLLSGICPHVHAQLKQPNRYEKEQKFMDEEFSLAPLQNEGLALIREKREYKSGNQTWEVILLDTALQAADPVEFQIDNKYNLIGYEHSPGLAFFLFNESDLRSYMNLVSIDIKTKEVKTHEIKPELNLQITHFSKVGE